MSMTVEQARARVKAAELRVRAASMDQCTAGYSRQASNPIYDGQSEICMGKAAEQQAFADRVRAQADLIEAEAGL